MKRKPWQKPPWAIFTPVKRLGTPEEIAAGALYLASS